MQESYDEHDKELIRTARTLPCTMWYVAYDLADNAHSPNAADELRSIGRKLSLLEEYKAGSI